MAFLRIYAYAGKDSQAISLELSFFFLELNMVSSLSPYSIKNKTQCCPFRVNFDVLGCFRESVIPLYFILNRFPSDIASRFLGVLRACCPYIWRVVLIPTHPKLLCLPGSHPQSSWLSQKHSADFSGPLVSEGAEFTAGPSACAPHTASPFDSHERDGVRTPQVLSTSQGRWEAERRCSLVQNLPASGSALSSPIYTTLKLKGGGMSVPLFKSPHQFLSWIP